MGRTASLRLVRTVVVSDLHLGSRSEGDVLRRRAAREKLIERVDGADRLVLLGDTIELRQGPAREAMAVAQPVLEELGAALGKARRGRARARQPRPRARRAMARAPRRARRAAAAEPRGASGRRRQRGDRGDRAVARAREAHRRLSRASGCATTSTPLTATTSTATPPCRRSSGSARGSWAGWSARCPRADARPEDYEAALAPLYAWMHALSERSGGGRRRPPSRGERGGLARPRRRRPPPAARPPARGDPAAGHLGRSTGSDWARCEPTSPPRSCAAPASSRWPRRPRGWASRRAMSSTATRIAPARSRTTTRWSGRCPTAGG